MRTKYVRASGILPFFRHLQPTHTQPRSLSPPSGLTKAVPVSQAQKPLANLALRSLAFLGRGLWAMRPV